MSSTCAIILAGGSGERFGRTGGKQLAPVLGRPVLSWTLEAFDACPAVTSIVLVCPANRQAEYAEVAFEPCELTTPVTFAPSGATRQDSMASGLAAVSSDVDVIAVHDGARPLVTPETVSAAIALLEDPAIHGVVVGHPSYDTLKVVDGRRITGTPDRSRYWQAQTPQVFRRSVLEAALRVAEQHGFVGTDDAAVAEHAGASVVMFEGPRENIKVTVAEDVAYVEAALRHRMEQQ